MRCAFWVIFFSRCALLRNAFTRCACGETEFRLPKPLVNATSYTPFSLRVPTGERCSSGERRFSRESPGVPRVPPALRTNQGASVLRASTTGQELIQRSGRAQRLQLSGARARARRTEHRRTPCQKGPSCGHSVPRGRRKHPRASRYRRRAGPQRGTFWKSWYVDTLDIYGATSAPWTRRVGV